MAVLALLAALLAPCSCSSLDDIRVPLDDVDAVMERLRAADTDGDQVLEWSEIVAAIRAALAGGS